MDPVAGGPAGGLQALALSAAAEILPILADLLRVRAGGLAQVRLLARGRARRRAAAALPAVPSRRHRSSVIRVPRVRSAVSGAPVGGTRGALWPVWRREPRGAAGWRRGCAATVDTLAIDREGSEDLWIIAA